MTLIPEGLRAAADYTRRIDVATSAVGPDYLRSPEKRNLDEYGALVLYSIAKPTIRLCSRLVELEDGGPAIIGLPRVGMDGEQFLQFKIRSMRVGHERLPHISTTKSADDSRITRIGRYVRRSSVDELPQLYNVFDGAMSLVGPRPRSVEDMAIFGAAVEDWQQVYTTGRPGLTGLEQIHARASSDIARIAEPNREYYEEASPKLDRDILRKTIGIVARARNAF